MGLFTHLFIVGFEAFLVHCDIFFRALFDAFRLEFFVHLLIHRRFFPFLHGHLF